MTTGGSEDGSIGKGRHSYRQAWWCLTRGPDACAAGLGNSDFAEAQLALWKQDPRFEGFDVNAMLHPLWFALNTGFSGMSDSDARALGFAHEMDWRTSYVDSARDLLNNEVGIAIGNEYWRPSDIVAAVEHAALTGRLWCISSGGGAALTSC